MDETQEIKALVRLVTTGLRHHLSETTLIDQMVEAGVPKAKAPELFRTIKNGCQRGVQAVLTDGFSAAIDLSRDPMTVEAFRVGRASMRSAIRNFWIRRIGLWGAVAAVLAAFAWWLWQ